VAKHISLEWGEKFNLSLTFPQTHGKKGGKGKLASSPWSVCPVNLWTPKEQWACPSASISSKKAITLNCSYTLLKLSVHGSIEEGQEGAPFKHNKGIGL
jgi:hypothetical protein